MICCTFSKNGTPYSDWNLFLTIPSKPMLSHAFHNRIQRNHMVLEIPFIGCFIWDRIFNSKPLELHCLITLASGNYIQCRTINVANLTGPCYRVETFLAEEEDYIEASCRASNLWPLHVNLEVESRSPQETGDITLMLEKDGIKDKILSKNDLDHSLLLWELSKIW